MSGNFLAAEPVLRCEEPGDVPAIRDVVSVAFPGDLESRLVECLRASGRLFVSVVALVEGRVVGHIAFSPVTHEGRQIGVGLAPLAVHPDFQRQGVGRRLVETGLSACQDRGFPCVVVLGDPAYYGRFGFAPASNWGLDNPFGGGPAFQILELQADGVPKCGQVTFAPDFDLFL